MESSTNTSIEIHDYSDDDFGLGFHFDFDEDSDPASVSPVVVPRSAYACEDGYSEGIITHNSCCNNKK